MLGTLFYANGATVDTIQIKSHLMPDKVLKATVVLPDQYALDTSKHYPSVYLLHGYSGNYRDWVEKSPQVKALSDQYGVIVVCPDGGYSSWYFDSPIDSTMRYESYFVKELVPAIDKSYRTIEDNRKRAITGLSMGGHGAMYLAIKHADIWWAMGSLSGGVDIRPFPENWDIKQRLGEYKMNTEEWNQNTILEMMDNVNANDRRPIIISCGTDDFFYDVNQNLHTMMVQSKIQHTYIVSEGGHNWWYWNIAVPYHFLFFDQCFRPYDD